MKTKIYDALKQAYSSLGLGEDFLQGHSEMLASIGNVTDENLKSVVEAQKSYLERIQKSNDSRVTAALKKAKEDAEKANREFAEKQAEAQRKIDEANAEIEKLKKNPAPKVDPVPPTNTEIPDFFKAYLKAEEERRKNEADAKEKAEKALAEAEKIKRDALKAQEKLLQEQAEAQHKAEIDAWKQAQEEQNKALAEQIKALTEEKNKLAAEQAKIAKEKADAEKAKSKAERANMIVAKAKELNIPEWRINEGFVIADDADEAKIGEVLGAIAGNLKTNLLPRKGASATMGGDDKKPEKEEISALAGSLLQNIQM